MILYNLPNVSELHGGNGDGDGNFHPAREMAKNDYIKSNYDKDTISFVFVTSMIQSHWKWKEISSEIFIDVF